MTPDPVGPVAVPAIISGSGGEGKAAIDAWVDRVRSAPFEELAEQARRSIARILAESSEFLELRQESDELDAWKRSVDEVSARL